MNGEEKEEWKMNKKGKEKRIPACDSNPRPRSPQRTKAPRGQNETAARSSAKQTRACGKTGFRRWVWGTLGFISCGPYTAGGVSP